MLKISENFYNTVASVVTLFFTTGMLSFILTFLNNKQNDFSFNIWLETWKLVFLLAYLISLFLPKLIRKTMLLIFEVIEK
jgi:succinate dehydrogenase hydrophobic anchor subunit